LCGVDMNSCKIIWRLVGLQNSFVSIYLI
jgi:hypothetical protein